MLATVDQFIDFVGREEAIQHSQLNNPESEVIDRVRIADYLLQAATLLNQKVPASWPCFAHCQLRIARHLLDPYSTREVVTKGAADAWELVANRPKVIMWT